MAQLMLSTLVPSESVTSFLARALVGGAEEGLAHLVHAALGEAADAQDLSPVQLERDVLELAGDADAPHGEGHAGGERLAVVLAVAVTTHLAADHESLELLLGHVLGADGLDELAVAQDADRVGHREDLGHVVADEDHGATVVADLVHDAEELVAAVLAEGRGGLVHDEDLGREPGGAHDLDELAVLEVVVLDGVRGLDVVQAVVREELLRLLVHGAGVLDPAADELVLVAEEHVLGDGEAVEGALLLDDDGGTVVVGVDLVPGGDLLAVQLERALADGDDAGEHVGEGRLAGAVLAYEGVHLSLVEVQGDVVDRVRGPEALVDAHGMEHDFPCHPASSLPT